MTTKLAAPFKREIAIDGEKYTLTLTGEGLKLVRADAPAPGRKH